MDRRGFIKDACSLCLAIRGGLAIGSISSCAPISAFETDVAGDRVRVPLSAFAGRKVLVVRVRSLMYDIALHDRGNNAYGAFLLRCTHADTQLTVSGEEYYCSEHGSRFGPEGKVKRGPARRDLVSFATENIDGAIVVHLPGALLH